MDGLQTERTYYFPMKILPWSSLSAGGSPLQRSQTEESVGFIPVYGYWEEVRRFFGPGVQVGTFTAIRGDRPLEQITGNHSDDPVLENFEEGVREGMRRAREEDGE